MKFQPDRLEGVNAISRHEPQRLWVNTTEWVESVLVPVRGDPLPWAVQRFEELAEEHFAQLLQLRPELVIFGSGPRLRFVRPALLRPLIQAGIGVETMDTAAACRTYNVLASEGRIVAAALLLERG
ncbi:Mth938-like domain-containing protein [Azohydromonas caseinilytica]|uniref:Xcc1710-like domain-containing protein n=1 Tax=Azohydromonas caseinilytica TaxID=2728836 RepID=A0A848F5M6_9BURK|nr:Mth938-like domain-containing protein [Azohydromonas caseinilytica]NML15367.1 Xcc1710-like domain-containing protein [Azohydromonas caseinilytica]